MSDPKDDQSESDVSEDPHVASTREGQGDDDGSYVGQTATDDAIDTGETGAEARDADRD